MNSKAEALASAKARIITLQSQMSSRILQMAKEGGRTRLVRNRTLTEFVHIFRSLPPVLNMKF